MGNQDKLDVHDPAVAGKVVALLRAEARYRALLAQLITGLDE